MYKLPIGYDDFKNISDEKLHFIDKTLMIRDVIDDPAAVLLFARPRRFGKTLNLSMLRYYFEKVEGDTSVLFENFLIWRQGERYRQEQGKYPVITLTFKSVKMGNWKDNFELLRNNIMIECSRHRRPILALDLPSGERDIYDRVMAGKATDAECAQILALMSKWLELAYGEKVIILLDEYDTLLNEAWIHGFYAEANSFLRAFVNEGFKNNPHLKKGIITGIFRVAKESIFSDMNNLKVCTMLSDDYREYFGFTEPEVAVLLHDAGMEDRQDEVARWYNGYRYGENQTVVIYNPWSIVRFMDSKSLEPYWVNTSGNAIIRKLATEGIRELQLSVQDIISGKVMKDIFIDENIVYSELEKSATAFWSFLLMSGYLKPVGHRTGEEGTFWDLQVPNHEVMYFYRSMMRNWMDESSAQGTATPLLKAMLTGDLEAFSDMFRLTVLKSVSFNDVGEDTSESFYHAFVLGMLVVLGETHEVKSNRESGYGRYDVMLIPRDARNGLYRKGIVMEFKKASTMRNESLEDAVAAAMRQIEEKQYETEMMDRGILHADIIKYAIAFKGKDVRMEMR